MNVHLIDEHPVQYIEAWGRPAALLGRSAGLDLLNDRDDRDPTAVETVVFEPYLAVDFGIEGVVFPQTDVETRLETSSFLSHQDGTTGDQVSVVTLDAKSLRVAVSAVT
jgi:hypothetical protein